MTLRRRFFPSTPVQQVPGQSVKLEVQLRPEAPAAAPPAAAPAGECECDVIGAGWLISMTAKGADMGAMELPDGRWVIGGYPVGPGTLTSYWEGVPEHFSDWGLPLEGPSFRCTRLELSSLPYSAPVIVGALQGRTLCGVRWQLVWDKPAEEDSQQSAFGHVAHAAGNMVWVHQFQGSDLWPDGDPELLTATAFCGGQQVAQLELEITPRLEA